MSNKRSVATDALATLGTIIGGDQKRDAIHLAVEPVIAGERLRPGDHITVVGGTAFVMDTPGTGLGIVDPFLIAPIKKGERFWFVMYPRMVHSLRHVWTHPAFPDEGGTLAPAVAPVVAEDAKAKSEAWLRNFCQHADCPSYERVIGRIMMGPTSDWDDNAEYLHFDGSDAHGDIPDEFWDHVEIVTGLKPIRAKYFSCSC